ncbi:MAG: metallophosphoesterase [Candidatus Gastranaerophilales bacterium]|nr:metallophosphoesterase [Candidatus Gastranaerophilales bacterium]
MKKFFIYVSILFLFLSATADAKTIKIAQITDTHIGSVTDDKTSDSIENLKKAIISVNKQKDIDLVVFTGDNIDKSKMEDLEIFCKTIKKLKKPYYVILGNHDAYKAAGIAPKTYMHIVNKSNPYQKTDALSYAVTINDDIKALMVSGITPNIQSSHGFFSEETMAWIKQTLQKNRHRTVIIFQHFPLMPPTEDKEREVLYADQYLYLLIRNPNILFLASGHYHTDKIQTDQNGITHISTPSLVNEKQYRIIEIEYAKTPLCKGKNYQIKTSLVDI